MKVHEYQAKDLLKAAGVAVPEGIVASTPEQAAEAFDKLGGGLIVVKAQVHAGGRGKGIAIGPDDDRGEALEIASGIKPRKEGMAKGVQLVRSKEDAKRAAGEMLGKTLVTYQTGAEGQMIKKVLVTVGHDIVQELYLGLAVDRELQCPVLMATTEGGVDIEIVAHETPEKIHREPIDIGVGLADFQARKVCQALGLKGDAAKNGEKFLKAFVQFFLTTDASLAEINPLIVTDKGEVLALDAKLNFDDNAMSVSYTHLKASGTPPVPDAVDEPPMNAPDLSSYNTLPKNSGTAPRTRPSSAKSTGRQSTGLIKQSRIALREQVMPYLENPEDLFQPPKADRPWKYVVLHHSANDEGGYDQIDRDHRKILGFEGCGYHFVIGNGTGSPDGQIEVADRWLNQKNGVHCRNGKTPDVNEYGIGICLVGNFDQSAPTPKQVAAAKTLVAYLSNRYSIPVDHLGTHEQFATGPTACPGKNFPTEAILGSRHVAQR